MSPAAASRRWVALIEHWPGVLDDVMAKELRALLPNATPRESPGGGLWLVCF